MIHTERLCRHLVCLSAASVATGLSMKLIKLLFLVCSIPRSAINASK
jgi:hypothetical protein